MDSDPSSPTSPLHQGPRSRQASRCSSTTIGSTTTTASTSTSNSNSTTESLYLPHELDDDDDDDVKAERGSPDEVEIAGIDKAFEELDVGKEGEDNAGLRGSLRKNGMTMTGKDDTNTNTNGRSNGHSNGNGAEVVEGNENEDGSEETLNEDPVGSKQKHTDADEVDEDYPLYQYTLALFEYTVSSQINQPTDPLSSTTGPMCDLFSSTLLILSRDLMWRAG
jgi:hypothetical protein